MEGLTCNVCGALPLIGVRVNHGTSVAAVKLKAPVPVLLTVSEAGDGLAPPTVALKAKLDGDTDSTGPLAAEPKADSGEFAKTDPVAQFDGKEVRVFCELVSDALPEAVSRKRKVPEPLGPSTAIQYVVPATTDTAGTGTSFQALTRGALRVPWVSSAPGCVPLLAYSPTVSFVALEPLST